MGPNRSVLGISFQFEYGMEDYRVINYVIHLSDIEICIIYEQYNGILFLILS